MKIDRSVIVLDLETTGIWVEKDKIVEIAMIKCDPTGNRETYLKRINPGIPIPPNVSQLIGIKDEDIKGAPSFKQVAEELIIFLKDTDLAGFNLERFDLPLLEREFFDAGIKWSWTGRTIFDAQKIYHINEKRDLTAAYKYYCQKDLEGAHSALADASATLEILCSQAEKYGDGTACFEILRQFNYKSLSDYYDEHRKFRWWNGELYPMFGKYAKRLSLQAIVRKDPKYLEWILAADFSEEIKELAGDALKGKFPEPQIVAEKINTA